jgi:plastocyanin
VSARARTNGSDQVVPGLVLLIFALALGACGGSSPSSPSTPAPTPSPSAPAGPTVILTPMGASPKMIQVPVGSQVTFVNQDNQVHEIFSDPHPEHTDCPPINDVGVLAPGQSRSTGALTVARTCGYHDHGMPTNTLFQGTIVIQ